MISAKNLVVRKPQTLHQRLVGLVNTVGQDCNKNELAQILITECIRDGVTAGSAIIAAIAALGLKTGHVAIQLKFGLESPAGFASWRKDADGQYRLNE